MSFPCLICGDLPLVPEQGISGATGGGLCPSPTVGRGGNTAAAALGTAACGGGKKGGTTIRMLSKDISDKIFQNLCRHLYVKTEPYWFIQNPGEQMPLCATCSAAVLEVYTWQTKVDQYQAMIKKHIWKLERCVADTEIASNWLATREEQESEEAMWNNIQCPPLAVRIARERHHKFRQQVLQNFKSKVKLRQKMRAAGQMSEVEPTFTVSLTEPVFDDDKHESDHQPHYSPQQSKRARLDDQVRNHSPIPVSVRASSSSVSIPVTPFGLVSSRNTSQSQRHVNSSPGLIYQSTAPAPAPVQSHPQFVDESELSDDINPEAYPDVQIVCAPGPIDYLKEEHDYSNSGDGEQDGSYWNPNEENMEEDDEEVAIPEGEEVVWLAPGVALRKVFLDQIQNEQLRPSVFLRKLAFAVFGLRRIANSSGISGSNKPGAKPSLDRYKFEALREYTIDHYGIRDNSAELEDLNRKIRTICCDARKAAKRRTTRPAGSNPLDILAFDGIASTSSSIPLGQNISGNGSSNEGLSHLN